MQSFNTDWHPISLDVRDRLQNSLLLLNKLDQINNSGNKIFRGNKIN